ncbi:hypothetical protein AQPE_2844 [Aquipluma nitroreducens]|uniref:Uncharacterized protein n=1 Tax=Aquipluma nitroreducens TaxID=2010828 RepID=A0A5K7SAT7_9BACT|nr:hypothetical protein [Aquipluma nitroreducens]BBE18680.1 hypothetical protein AQPE_2844 [Aquipluma nitroreducens]
MAQRNFKPQHSVAGKKYSKTSVIMSNVLLAAGSLMIVFLLGYLFFNLDKSDLLVNSLMPFFFAGIGLIILSQLICPFQFKSRR